MKRNALVVIVFMLGLVLGAVSWNQLMIERPSMIKTKAIYDYGASMAQADFSENKARYLVYGEGLKSDIELAQSLKIKLGLEFQHVTTNPVADEYNTMYVSGYNRKMFNILSQKHSAAFIHDAGFVER